VKRATDGCAGSITLLSVFLLFAASIAFAALATSVVSVTSWLSFIDESRDRRSRAAELVEQAVELWKADPSPESHSFHDPLWQLDAAGMRLTDLTGVPGTGGPRAATAVVAPRYTYLNVNTAPRARLLEIARARLPAGIPAGRVMGGVLSARAAGEIVTGDDLSYMLGSYHEMLFPVITAAPLVNVNTAPPEVVQRLVRSVAADVDIHAASELAARIAARRRAEEIDTEELESMLGPLAHGMVGATLGVRSHALLLEMNPDDSSFEAVIMRIPKSSEVRVVRFAEVNR
jgi:type II secretory pathway component PulK